jgi:poly-gamma-glutamate capsule biosynthesis protein CapA/YwtB (metallophosphatase superfamily)
VAFANLEARVTTSSDRFPLYKKYIYKVAPEAVAAWQWLGLDVIGLANNHTSDYRDQGLLDTLAHLDAGQLTALGAGKSEREARRPVIVDVGGTTIGYLAYLEDDLVYNLYMRAFALGDRPGSARAITADLAEDVARLRPLVDVLVVTVHWGDNYAPVTARQERLGKELAALGVDLVVGHHPHVAQPVAVHDQTVVLYSLGNYAWGAIGRADLTIGLIARVRVTPRQGQTPGRIRHIELIPIHTQNRKVKFQPRPLLPTEMPLLAPLLQAAKARGVPLLWDGRILYVPFGDATSIARPAPTKI